MNHYNQITDNFQIERVYGQEEGGFDFNALNDTIKRKMPVVLGVAAAMSSLTFFYAANRTPLYESSLEILSEPVTIETKVSSTDSQAKETTEEVTAVELNEVQIKILKSPELINLVVEQLGNQYPAINYNSIVRNLELKTSSLDETILEVTYKHPNSKIVEEVLDILASTYIDYSLQRRLTGVNRGLEFLDGQILRLQANVDRLNLQLQQIRKEHNFIEPTIRAQQLSARLDGFVQAQLTNKSELDRARWDLNLVRQESEKETNSTPITAVQFGTDRYHKLLANIQELDRQIANKSAIFSDNSIELKTLRDEKDSIQTLLGREETVIKQKLNNQINSLEEQNRIISEDVANLKNEIKKWLEITQNYEAIQRQIDLSNKQLNQLLTQREVLKIESAQKVAPWRLLTAIEEPQISSASTANYVVLGTLLGLLGGVSVAYAFDKYEDRVYTINKLKEITDLPVLSTISFDRCLTKSSSAQKTFSSIQPKKEINKSEIQIYNRKPSSFNLLASSMEPYFFLGANLGLLRACNSLNSLLITSAIPGEGKSTVALNLAKAVASMGRRVLLVDADMRSISRISDRINISQNLGLTNLLLNPDLNLHEVIHHSFVDENLYILSSNSHAIFTKPSKLLVSERMTEVMETAKQNFDLVIYDVSSVVGYADFSLLAAKTDGVVLVTGLGKLQNLKLKEAVMRLKVVKTRILGIVVNQLVK